ncbi:uncharacterized protein LOC126964692 [Leptidea sinapis]|uniref:uncharacterized protein LOC126964692 n=1 Tax=Leptidea sinapis TaxID=189913 RepID=UPI0021C4850B|nr:uncharacterized protein LOC126964692 [Leptidea sinapis]
MEDTSGESNLQQPPKRRRSTFFERRDSIMPQPAPDNILDSQATIIDGDEKRKEELLRYYDQLMNEKQQWKREINEKRSKYHDLRQQLEIATASSSRSKLDYSVLTSEDIEFLNAKVNISKLVEIQQDLHKSLMQTKEFYRKASQLNNVIVSHCENKINEVTDYIIENSTISD